VDPVARRARGAALLAAILSLGAAVGAARADVGLNGFVQANHSARVSGAPHPLGGGDFLLGDERVQIQMEGFSDGGEAAFSAKVDLYQDALKDESVVEVREAFVDLTSDLAGLRLGRQIVTWGVGDLLFVNDLYPKDWLALFAGRPLEYLKVASDALKADAHLGSTSVEIVVAPYFQPDRYPTAERLVLPDPFPAGTQRREVPVERSFENVGLSAKASRYVGDWELAAYAARTRFRSPAMMPDDPANPTEVRLAFPRLVAAGGSGTGGALGGIVSLEAAYYDSRDDSDGTDPFVENSQVKGLVGYNRSLWTDGTLGAQLLLERMLEFGAYRTGLPPGAPARDEVRQTGTIRFTQLFLHQTLTLNVFAFWGITETDGYVIPSLRYAFSDPLWGEIGANVFLAERDDTMFGAFDANDNIYVSMRYGF
jgi:hypothetical protein